MDKQPRSTAPSAESYPLMPDQPLICSPPNTLYCLPTGECVCMGPPPRPPCTLTITYPVGRADLAQLGPIDAGCGAGFDLALSLVLTSYLRMVNGL